VNRLATASAVVILAAVTYAYPPYVQKHLYASVDLRGQKMPPMMVAKWLTGAAPDTKGKTVLLDMWATWCPSCRDLIPEMNRWASKFKGKLVIIGLSDEDSAKVKQFMAQTPMKYNIGVDPGQRLERALSVEGIPHVLVASPDGIVRWQGFPGDETDPLTDAKLASIISGK
jgi:thiol-disulfide isomerase/thioredoxin